MQTVCVKVRRLSDRARMPVYATEGAAGMDLYALLDAPVALEPGQRAKIPTGLAFEIPDGYEAQIRPRSGLALKCGITVLNAPGTIDSDYRGEIQIIIINLGEKAETISNGDRVAQAVFAPTVRAVLEERENLCGTARAGGGFGSTGK